jgi:hypothetical protein
MVVQFSRATVRAASSVFCALALTFGLTAPSSAVPAGVVAAAGKAVVEISAPSKTKAGGGETVIRGVVSGVPGGGGVAGVALTAQVRVAKGAWKSVETSKTRSTGRFAIRVPLAATAGVRVVAKDSSGRQLGSSATSKVVVPQRVRVSAKSARSVDVGEPVDISGWTSVGLRGRRIVLQVQAVDGWVNVGSARVNSSGAYQVTGRLDSPGRGQRLRVYAPGVAKLGIESAVVGAGQIGVFAWYPLDAAHFERVDYHGLSDDASVRRVAGVAYPGSAALYAQPGGEAFVTYALGAACSDVRFSVGVDDSATLASGVAYGAAVDSGATRVWQGDIGWGGVVPVRAALGGSQSVSLRAWGLGAYNPETSNHIVFGQVEVRCAP